MGVIPSRLNPVFQLPRVAEDKEESGLIASAQALHDEVVICKQNCWASRILLIIIQRQSIRRDVMGESAVLPLTPSGLFRI